MAMRTCPFCKKRMHHQATVCPYCTRQIKTVSYWKTTQGALVAFILIIFGLGFIGNLIGDMQGQSTPKREVSQQEPFPPAPFKKGQDVLLSGTNARGEVEVPHINLWDAPGGIATGAKVKSTLNNGTPAKILASRYVNDRWFFLVEGQGQKGWVTDSLLRARW